MADRVVDTNVLIVATAAEPGAHRGDTDTHVPAVERQKVLTWMRQFRTDADRSIVLDVQNGIRSEYANKLSAEAYGRRVVVEKIQKNQVTWVSVEYDREGAALLDPEDLQEAVHDAADRKMVAAYLKADPADRAIVNACDTDWLDLQADGTLGRHGIVVEHVIEPFCRAEWERKKEREGRE